MKSGTSLLVLFGLLATTIQATDYCSPSLCRNGARHIGCGNTGQFSPSCPLDRRVIPMSSGLIKSILDLHNRDRQTLASGRLSGFAPAPRMATIMWDDELSSVALMNAKTCKSKHDKCRNTHRYESAGQNIAIKWSKEPFAYPYTKVISGMVDSWWDEYKKTDRRLMQRYRSTSTMSGHFTVMSVDNNNAMGCGASTYKDKHMNAYAMLFVCNYGKTNMKGQRIYEEGRTATKCQSGTNPNFRALCSMSEHY